MRFLTGQGIGDSIWSLFKLQAIAKRHGAKDIHLLLGVSHADNLQRRALEFLRRFKFLNSVELYVIKPRPHCRSILLRPGAATDQKGRYRYVPDGPPGPELGWSGVDYVAIPNGHLEAGNRLETWLPGYETRWDIFKDFEFTPEERRMADEFVAQHGRFAVFYLSNLRGNTVSGHNKGPIWTPYDWQRLGAELYGRYGLKILVVGADWDRSFWEEKMRPILGSGIHYWINCIGNWPNPCQTYAVLKRAELVVSYQSGIGIVSHYLDIPTAIFWRPDGNSTTREMMISFSENMAHAWAYPDWAARRRFLPCIYGKHGVDYLLGEFANRHWVTKP